MTQPQSLCHACTVIITHDSDLTSTPFRKYWGLSIVHRIKSELLKVGLPSPSAQVLKRVRVPSQPGPIPPVAAIQPLFLSFLPCASATQEDPFFMSLGPLKPSLTPSPLVPYASTALTTCADELFSLSVPHELSESGYHISFTFDCPAPATAWLHSCEGKGLTFANVSARPCVRHVVGRHHSRAVESRAFAI